MNFSYKVMTLLLVMGTSTLMEGNSGFWEKIEPLKTGYKYMHDNFFPVRSLTGFLVGYSSIMSLTSGIECITTMGQSGKARFLFGLLGLGISVAAESVQPKKWGDKSLSFSLCSVLGGGTALIQVPYTRELLKILC